MKRTSILLFVFFILIKLSSGQGVNCSGADLFCPPSSPPASINAGSAETGPNYGCLYSEPNPAWYYVQVGVSGAINIQLSSTPAHDIDFICWGPFTSPTAPCTSQLTAANTTACSYSASATENCNIPNAVAGQIYILLVTNYSNLACNINFTQTNSGQSGAGSINCCALNISSPPTNSICTGVPLNYTITSPVSTAVYTWSRGAQAGISNAAANNQTSNPITETLINTTASPIVVTYMITPQADGCTSYPFIYSLTVNPKPVINAMSKTTCSGVAYTITPANGTDGIVPSVTTYSWS
ncbi:MAG: PKD-like domain-containing protein, partial [Bacteroidota bacterium]